MDLKRYSIKPYLKTLKLQPENQEMPIQFVDTDLISNGLFYRRNHFSYPTLSYSNYWVPIIGMVKTPLMLSFKDIQKLPAKTLKMVLECSGDKRQFFEPKVFGEQWGHGAISQGLWKGVPLHNLLQLTGITQGAKEVVVEGYDFGNRTDKDGVYSFARSLPLEKALHPDTLVAYEYNHQPIPFKHGFPLRLIVPQWYAMASVKWIKQIRIIDSTFTGPFQSIDYVYYPNIENDLHAFPVTTMHVNSTIQKPLNMELLNTGTILIKGIAWTGRGYITKVEISTDDGDTWTNVKEVYSASQSYEWVSWSYEWKVQEKGEYTIRSRAADSYDRIQPLVPFWNRKGYGYNAIDKIKVKIE